MEGGNGGLIQLEVNDDEFLPGIREYLLLVYL